MVENQVDSGDPVPRLHPPRSYDVTLPEYGVSRGPVTDTGRCGV